MVAEAWILKMGNQVSHNLKHALSIDSSKKNPKKSDRQKETIGILSFEVANVMSKTVHLHKSLTDNEISKLKNEILKFKGVVNLVSSDESYLLELALAEKLDDLSRIVSIVSRLGKRWCSEPALQGFEHVYGDIVSGVIDVRKLGFLVRDMDGMVRKMEKYVSATSSLYNEIQVLNELEQASKKFQLNQHEESRRVYEQKLMWQKQDVRHLKDISLWNQTHDKIVGLLVRTICTIYARLCTVFGDSVARAEFPGHESVEGSSLVEGECGLFSGPMSVQHSGQLGVKPMLAASSKNRTYDSGPLVRAPLEKRGTVAGSGMASRRTLVDSFHHEVAFPCGASPGRLFMECLSLSSSAFRLGEEAEQDSRSVGCCSSTTNELQRQYSYPSGYSDRVDSCIPFSSDQRQIKCGTPKRLPFGPKSRLMMHASSSTIGGSALALHYANVIIVIEKLLRYPHLVGDEVRDDLYQMLPTSLRMSLRKNLKAYVKNLAIYDASLAHDWKETLDKILSWLAPFAHNMIKWQTERNLEQQQIITRANVLLLQTLYFADRKKTEAAICELLVGLNYICRYEQQQNALLDCASSFDFEDCTDWRWQDSFLTPRLECRSI